MALYPGVWEVKKGDIFRWYYKSIAGKFSPYHCCSCIAEFNGNRLYDTFWNTGLTDGKSWTPEEAERKLELTLIANRDDLVKTGNDARRLYKKEDIVDLRHSNSTTTPLYIRRGAVRDKGVMQASLEENVQKAESAIEWANRRISENMVLLGELEDGKRLDDIYIPWSRD